MIETLRYTISQLIFVLEKIHEDKYNKPSHFLFGATIGQHNRHIIEVFQCLLMNKNNEKISYDNRKRDLEIEQIRDKGIQELNKIIDLIHQEDCILFVESSFNMKKQEVKSTYLRELIYNLEHCIHHMALIKVALLEFKINNIPENFGVAPSTIDYKKNQKLKAN